ncbi:ribosome silencing factor [Anaplasma marginale]|uniref:Ribosomal silencing factor RsfS n=1 Tax=Anaplasma marginale TaxID=770 RepID=A0A643CJW3_ANAMA|nr:ribosome silencing factor [Anaplasma marginale]AXW84279.1 ribosome silencing factor [Anaplasma marginale]AXW85204.1 ribosome silencing factor [Anaplasma marginale]KAA8473292.1 ribosome silencing factor [Anaplasma marginale]KAB0450855.1 ribosome silencing factor [Anaplasma marginale]KAB0451609.1 ribosome silencing factor [Anaplasma marginale]
MPGYTELKDSVVAVLDEHSASDIVVLDVAGRCQLTEHMIIASGNSSTHVKSLVEHIKKKVSKSGKVLVEGLRDGNWVVISMEGVIVHIFRPEVRSYYRLEELWSHSSRESAQCAGA